MSPFPTDGPSAGSFITDDIMEHADSVIDSLIGPLDVSRFCVWLQTRPVLTQNTRQHAGRVAELLRRARHEDWTLPRPKRPWYNAQQDEATNMVHASMHIDAMHRFCGYLRCHSLPLLSHFWQLNKFKQLAMFMDIARKVTETRRNILCRDESIEGIYRAYLDTFQREITRYVLQNTLNIAPGERF
ncbi:hypothetical protein CALVIDRAFT_51638 [Calocera viscosa TUFC12733]|uniref:Uncharacterized protein n=1 Tax=Calocera viscosa (strain TUFC12733) TaxID=1330018 RepID=A0A167NSN7_CALVF|nr:hypothetical protein CALVIDRAFT_51638 [Calocera viscosa TUFC12733]